MKALGSIRWSGVIAGALIALLAGLLLSPAVRSAYQVLAGSRIAPERFTAGLVTDSLLVGFIAYLIGGYVAGRFVQSAGGANGAMTAVLGLALGSALASLGIVSSGGVLVAAMGLNSTEMALSVVAVLFLAELFGGYVGGKLGERPGSGIRRSDG